MGIDKQNILWYTIPKTTIGGEYMKNKKADYIIIAPQSAFRFVLELIAHDNPSLRAQIKEILEAYSQ